MAENTLQFEWIVTIQCGLEAQYRLDEKVFVAGDLFWYPVEGDNTLRTAPDILVAFGRPKGFRGSYMQWLEDFIAPQVVFEILSPSNRGGQMVRKFKFYERYGVEEYYVYDPDEVELSGWLRSDGTLNEIPTMAGWVSPRLKIRFERTPTGLVFYHQDGQPFLTQLELVEQLERERSDADRARQRADEEKGRADQARQRADQLAAQLRALGITPDA
jgi:Uma2 family endonuclease